MKRFIILSLLGVMLANPVLVQAAQQDCSARTLKRKENTRVIGKTVAITAAELWAGAMIAAFITRNQPRTHFDATGAIAVSTPMIAGVSYGMSTFARDYILECQQKLSAPQASADTSKVGPIERPSGVTHLDVTAESSSGT